MNVLDLGSMRVSRGAFEVVVRGLQFIRGSVILAGPNGSGKSSLLGALAGLLAWDGTAHISGHAVSSRQGQTRIGYLPQDPRGLEHMRFRDALRYVSHISAGRQGAHLQPAMDLGVSEQLERRIGELSGGQRRLAYLAMTTLHDPDVVLLDEPTAGIDAQHRVAIRRVIDRISERALVLTASHLPDDIEHLGHRTIVMRRGRVVFDGSRDELRAIGEDAKLVGTGPMESALAHMERDA